MIPTQGRSVIVKGVPSNGTDTQPAVITRVWSKGDPQFEVVAVNLMVFPDAGTPHALFSVRMYNDRMSADRSGDAIACYWPDRA